MIPLRYNLRSILVRRTTSAMTASGVAMVAMVMLLLLGFVEGLRRTVTQAAEARNWVVLARGTTSEPSSSIKREEFEIIRSRPEIATGVDGQPLFSPEMVTGFQAGDPDDLDSPQQLTYIRGVYPVAYKVHDTIKVQSGRLPAPGTAEMIVGSKLAARFPSMDTGESIRFGRRAWKVVGIFADSGSARESEVWTNLDVLQQDLHNSHQYGGLHLVMKPGMGDAFKEALTKDSRLSLDAMTEHEFYADQAQLADQLRALGLVVAIILAIGTIFGGMNTMYTAVARRSREVGVLRALGFGRGSVLLSFVAESMILAFVGGVCGEILGVATAYATGLDSRLMNVGAFIFSFRLSPEAFVWGLIVALIIGVLGGLPPAIRAARMHLEDALRDG